MGEEKLALIAERTKDDTTTTTRRQTRARRRRQKGQHSRSAAAHLPSCLQSLLRPCSSVCVCVCVFYATERLNNQQQCRNKWARRVSDIVVHRAGAHEMEPGELFVRHIASIEQSLPHLLLLLYMCACVCAKQGENRLYDAVYYFEAVIALSPTTTDAMSRARSVWLIGEPPNTTTTHQTTPTYANPPSRCGRRKGC